MELSPPETQAPRPQVDSLPANPWRQPYPWEEKEVAVPPFGPIAASRCPDPSATFVEKGFSSNYSRSTSASETP